MKFNPSTQPQDLRLEAIQLNLSILRLLTGKSAQEMKEILSDNRIPLEQQSVYIAKALKTNSFTREN